MIVRREPSAYSSSTRHHSPPLLFSSVLSPSDIRHYSIGWIGPWHWQIRMKKVDTVILTALNWETMGGLPGAMLSMADSGTTNELVIDQGISSTLWPP